MIDMDILIWNAISLNTGYGNPQGLALAVTAGSVPFDGLLTVQK